MSGGEEDGGENSKDIYWQEVKTNVTIITIIKLLG